MAMLSICLDISQILFDHGKTVIKFFAVLNDDSVELIAKAQQRKNKACLLKYKKESLVVRKAKM